MLVHRNKSGLTFLLDRVTGEFPGVFSVPELQDFMNGGFDLTLPPNRTTFSHLDAIATPTGWQGL